MSTSQENTMTDNDSEMADDLPKVDELALLKDRARAMGIEFSNNIGLDTLKERIRAKMEQVTEAAAEATPAPFSPPIPPTEATAPPPADPSGTGSPPAKKLTLRQYMINENMRLVRLRITCMDPKKRDLHGEFHTVANEYLGTVRKYIPYGEATDEGYHVPYCLYKHLRDKKFLNIRTIRDRRTGATRVESSWVREFALEILDPLTPEELQRLAIAQAAAGSLN